MATKSTSEEDSVAAPVELCSPSQTVVEPMSHRRMAFRPPTEPLSSAGTTDVQKIELSTAECSSGAGNNQKYFTGTTKKCGCPARQFNKMDCEISKFKPSISGTLINGEERHPKKSKTWNYDEVMVFYEGLKQCAKDFDGTMRIMATEKVEKNKEQTENYYFSLLKHVKQSISLDGDSMGDIGRGAKELFITINACEWRRRTNNNQYIPDRMKVLIFHGATTIPIRDKSKKKSGPIKIKTPPCPSLLKFFYISVSCEQNPLLRIRLNTNDRIARNFQLLRHEWSSALDKNDANGSRRMSGFGPEVRLFAGKDTEVGCSEIWLLKERKLN